MEAARQVLVPRQGREMPADMTFSQKMQTEIKETRVVASRFVSDRQRQRLAAGTLEEAGAWRTVSQPSWSEVGPT